MLQACPERDKEHWSYYEIFWQTWTEEKVDALVALNTTPPPLQWSRALSKQQPRLATICGGKKMARTEVTKKIWAYIKKNKLNEGDMFGLTPS